MCLSISPFLLMPFSSFAFYQLIVRHQDLLQFYNAKEAVIFKNAQTFSASWSLHIVFPSCIQLLLLEMPFHCRLRLFFTWVQVYRYTWYSCSVLDCTCTCTKHHDCAVYLKKQRCTGCGSILRNYITLIVILVIVVVIIIILLLLFVFHQPRLIS